MPCPFYSQDDNECSLLAVASLDDDDRPEQDEPEPVDLALCLDNRSAFHNCDIYKRHAIEQTRAF